MNDHAGFEVGPPLVGRTRELAELSLGLQGAAQGCGRGFLISGVAGIGKTRLAGAIAEGAERTGIASAWGRCWEDGGAPAFWPWKQLVRGVLRRLDESAALPVHQEALAPLLAPASARPEASWINTQHARFQLFEAVTEFFAAASSCQALLLILDDLHAADTDSLLLLESCLRVVRRMRLLLVGTYRAGEASGPLAGRLADLARETTHIHLEGLDEESVGRLAQEVLTEVHSPAAGRTLPAALTSRLHELTDGNPFFVREIVRAAAAHGDRLLLDTAVHELPLPEHVREVMRRRLRPLSAEAVEVLSLAAAIGREFDARVLERALTALGGTAQVPSRLDEARAAGVISQATSAGSRYVFSHALIRETLYEALSHAERARAHQAAGTAIEALSGRGPDPPVAELAHHFVRALPLGEVERAVAYSRRAAERAASSFAYDDAVAHWQRAVDAVDAGAPDAVSPERERVLCDVLLGLGAALNDAGMRGQSKAVFQRAADAARALGDPALLARAALGCGGDWSGHAEVAKADAAPGAVLDDAYTGLLREALARLGDADIGLGARLRSRLAVELYFTAPYGDRAALTDEAMTLARRLGDPVALAYVLAETWVARLGPHNVPERLGLAREVVRLAQAGRHLGLEASGRSFSVTTALEWGDADELAAEVHAFNRLADRTQLPSLVWMTRVYRALDALLTGNFSDAEQLARAAQSYGRRAGESLATFSCTLQLLALRREQGRLGDMSDTIGAFKAVADAYPNLPHLRAAVAFTYAELDRLEDARGEFTRANKHDFADFPLNLTWFQAMTELAEVCTRLDDQPHAAPLYALLSPYARYNVVSAITAVCWGSVSRSLGLLAGILGRWDDAERHFEAALDRNRAFGARPWVAHTQHGYAAMLVRRAAAEPAARAGHLQRAHALLTEALAAAQALGMERLHSVARALLDGMDWTTGNTAAAPTAGSDAHPKRAAVVAVFRKEGDYWTVAYEGTTCRLKDAKGLHYLAHLLRHPGQEFHALDLVQGGALEHPGLDTRDAEPLLDAQAKAAYKCRLGELREELAEAEANNDIGRAARAHAEMEAITEQLAAAVGLGGRDRKTGTPAERARLLVTQRLKATLKKIRENHPTLGHHLATSIRTGYFCSYTPDQQQPITWTV
jgi:tetratricopeptide (TPR) repeat protein